MASPTAATRGKGSPAKISVNFEKSRMQDRVKARIAVRAYELYQREGNRWGQDLRHWLQAESELFLTGPEIRESSAWFTINVALNGFEASEVEVSVEPQYAIIAAEKKQASATERGGSSDDLEQTVFTRANWPDAVDPNTASAYLKNGVLTLTVKRATPSASAAETGRASQKTS
jgi:HSP20 family molecular chaperone IbpA